MAKNQAQAEAIREAIREVIAISPLLGCRPIAKAVSEKLNIPVSEKYILKIIGKVNRQAETEMERKRVIKEIASISELTRVMTNQLNKIIFAKDGEATNNERVYAASQALHLQHKMFTLHMNSGLFKNAEKKEKEAKEQPVELSEEEERFFENIKNWGSVIRERCIKSAPVMLDAREIDPNKWIHQN